MRRISFLLLALMVLVGCRQKVSNDWARWRGPNGDGRSAETEWSHENLDSSKILWTRNIGWGHSAISVKGNHCFASGWNEKVENGDTTQQSTLYCLDLFSGRSVWEFTYPSANRSFPGPRSTPVIDEDRIYQLSWEGQLYCLNVETGKELWHKDLHADSLTVIDDWGYNPSPVIVGNSLLLNLNKNGIALNKRDGSVVWNSPAFPASYASVQMTKLQGKPVGVFIADTLISLVNIDNGKVEAQYSKKNRKSNHNDVMVVDESTLFASNELLKIDGNQISQVWESDSVSSNFRTGVIVGDYAYQFSDHRRRGYLYCIDLKTGVPKWRSDLGMWGALAGTPDRLVVITGLGKLMIIEANPEKYNVLAELQVLPGENKEGNWCWNLPALCKGLVLVRNSKGDMACVDLRKK